ncbi:hypothetical protein ACTG4Q_20555 [Bradyrhizobium denitrificans]
MDTKFTFKVKDWNADGSARVEYIHAVLGTVTKSVFIPLNFSEEEQRSAIMMQFPSTMFHSRWLGYLQREAPLPAPAAMEGEFVFSLERPDDNLVEQAHPVEKV